MSEKKFCKTYFGGYHLDRKNQCPRNNYSMHIFDGYHNRYDIFSIIGYGEYESKNDKEWERLGVFIDEILMENKKLRDTIKIMLSLNSVFGD